MVLQFPRPVMLSLFPKRSYLRHNFTEYYVAIILSDKVKTLKKIANCALPWEIPQGVEVMKAETTVPEKSVIVDSPAAVKENFKLFSGKAIIRTGTMNTFP
jgi:hypothetical protein